MSEFFVKSIIETDRKSLAAVDSILASQNLKRDRGLDCIAVVENDEYEIVATGSALGNTLRCFAVKDEYKGEGLLEKLMTYLMVVQMQRGNSHVFLYTKPSSVMFFENMGFYEIARVGSRLVFMENKRKGFDNYLSELAAFKQSDKKVGCIVMNANPFTKGHRYLIEQALKNCDILHLFLVSEDRSAIPYLTRKQLVLRGIEDLSQNVVVHDSGSYIISSATFPSYFLGNDRDVEYVHASLDATVFVRIATALGVNVRFVGTEPFSEVTAIYNNVLSNVLPSSALELKVIERYEIDGTPVSASAVRKAICDDDFDVLKKLLPESSLAYFMSEEAKPVIEKIKANGDAK